MDIKNIKKSNKNISNNHKNSEPPFIKIFGKSKLAKIFAIVFLILVMLFFLTTLKSYILGLVIIFLPLFLSVVTCSIIHPIAKFFSTILRINYLWFTYLIYFIYLIFVFFLCFIIIEVFFVQWTPFIANFLGKENVILNLLEWLKKNLNDSFSSIKIQNNNTIIILLNSGQHKTFADIGSVYIFFFKIINLFWNNVPVHIVYSFLNVFYDKVSIFSSGSFGLIYKLAPILFSVGMIIVFGIVITVVFLNKYKIKLSTWVALKFWESKENQLKVEKVFDKSVKAWSQALIIDELIIFSIILLTVILAGILGNSSIFSHSFIVFPIFMAICCLVPIIGPIVGTIPMLIVSILEISNNSNYIPLIIVLIGITIAISLEALVVSPIIYSKTTKLNFVTVLLGISVFGLILGIWFMPFAVPSIMMFKEICNQIYNFKLKI